MKGILFKPWKVKWISQLKEDETGVTRRVIKPQPERGVIAKCPGDDISFANFEMYYDANKMYGRIPIGKVIKPRYQVGETVYIKEAWRFINVIGKTNPNDFGIEYFTGKHQVNYWRDNAEEYDYPLNEKLRSPMFLPEKFARYFIQILDVRAEILQLPLPPEELALEGGEEAVPMLEKINGLWVWRYELELVPPRNEPVKENDNETISFS